MRDKDPSLQSLTRVPSALYRTVRKDDINGDNVTRLIGNELVGLWLVRENEKLLPCTENSKPCQRATAWCSLKDTPATRGQEYLSDFTLSQATRTKSSKLFGRQMRPHLWTGPGKIM